MRRSTHAVLATLRRLQGFLDANRATAALGLETVRRRLDYTATMLERKAAEREALDRAAKAAAEEIRSLRQRLRIDHMRPIAIIANRWASPSKASGVLRVPRDHVSSSRLIAAARTVQHVARRRPATFTDVGLRHGFAESFQQLIGELTHALNERHWHNRTKVSATAALAAAEKDGRALIKLLDALVRPRIRSDEAAVAAWRAAILIGGKEKEDDEDEAA